MTRRWWRLEAGLLLILCAWGTGVALGRLGAARAAHRAMAAAVTAAIMAGAEPFLLPPTQAVRSHAALRERIARLAPPSRILVERITPARAAPHLVAADIVLSGSEPAVLGLIHGIEAGPPAMRLARWRIEALPGGAVRLSGRVMAGW